MQKDARLVRWRNDAPKRCRFPLLFGAVFVQRMPWPRGRCGPQVAEPWAVLLLESAAIARPPPESFAAFLCGAERFNCAFLCSFCRNGVLCKWRFDEFPWLSAGAIALWMLVGCSLPQLSRPCLPACSKQRKQTRAAFIPFHRLAACVCESVSHGWQGSAAQAHSQTRTQTQTQTQTLLLSTSRQALLMSFVPSCCCVCRCSVVGGKLMQ